MIFFGTRSAECDPPPTNHHHQNTRAHTHTHRHHTHVLSSDFLSPHSVVHSQAPAGPSQIPKSCLLVGRLWSYIATGTAQLRLPDLVHTVGVPILFVGVYICDKPASENTFLRKVIEALELEKWSKSFQQYKKCSRAKVVRHSLSKLDKMQEEIVMNYFNYIFYMQTQYDSRSQMVTISIMKITRELNLQYVWCVQYSIVL